MKLNVIENFTKESVITPNTIIKGDCLEVMKNIEKGSVDLVLTDPPYGMSFQSGRRKTTYKKIKNDDNLDWLDTFVSESKRVISENGCLYVFCSKHNINVFMDKLGEEFSLKNILIWEKNNTSMGDLKGAFADKNEFILFYQNGRRTINGKRDSNILKFDRTGNIFHPTQKPVDLLSYLIEKFSDEGDVVLDPFAGSLSTALACINTNRKFIGIETDEKYFEVGKNRITERLNDIINK